MTGNRQLRDIDSSREATGKRRPALPQRSRRRPYLALTAPMAYRSCWPRGPIGVRSNPIDCIDLGLSEQCRIAADTALVCYNAVLEQRGEIG